MITFEQFYEIKKYEARGFTSYRVAKEMPLSIPTIEKYFKVSEEKFNRMMINQMSKKGKSKCSFYSREIIELLKDDPGRDSANIYDRLREAHGELAFSERTLRRYIQNERKKLDLPKRKNPRNYVAVEELKPGLQAQADFGEYRMRLETDPKKQKKVYFFVMVLKYSRYKYVEFSERKFTTEAAVKAHINAFNYFGGIPLEVVYDQDKVFIISENKGELIESETFKYFYTQMPFTHYVARASDPETKGLVEKTVSFTKSNFLRGRLFSTKEKLNEECLRWLERTANYNICQANNKRPVDLIEKDQQAMYPISMLKKFKLPFTKIITYQLNKDNTVTYKGCRYRVPYGTYNKTKNHLVGLQEENGILYIFELPGYKLIATHPVSQERGKVVGDKPAKPLSHLSFETIIEASNLFSQYTDASSFLKQVCSNYQRYIPEQMQEIISAFRENSDLNELVVTQALADCQKHNNYSGNYFRKALKATNKRLKETETLFTAEKENESTLKLKSMWELL